MSFRPDRRAQGPSSIRAIVLLCAGFALMFSQPARTAHTTQPLKFFKNYFVTGDYAIGSVGMREIDGTTVDEDTDAGFTTRTIPMTLPDDGDDKVIVAAFIYWQTIVTDNQGSGTNGVLFRGQPITAGTPAVTTAELLNPSGTTPCWSNGGAAGGASGTRQLLSFRTDVLGFLPRALIDHDNDPSTAPLPVGERLVDDDALIANQELSDQWNLGLDYSLTRATLPNTSSGNQVPLTNGVSFVVVYRDEKPGAKFRGISVYDGGFTIDQAHDVMSQTIEGFYQSSSVSPEARVTFIAGDGQNNFHDRALFNGTVLAGGPGAGAFNGDAGPRWDGLTFSGLPMPANAASVNVTVDHGNPPFTPYDCISFSAILFSTTVQDTDNDGLLDTWENNDSISALTDPNGVPLPRLKDLNANAAVKDLFFQMDFMSSLVADLGPGEYSTPMEGTVSEHRHVPDYKALKMVGDAFKNAPVKNPTEACGPGPNKVPCGPTGIRVHFDIGSHYQTNGLVENGETFNPVTDGYVISSANAKGGEAIPETQECTVEEDDCAFPGFYGVVAWKTPYIKYRDEPLNKPPTSTQSREEVCMQFEPGGTFFDPTHPETWCERRFERVRLPMFRYVLWAHFLGREQKDDPATPDIDEGKFPKKNSGIADLPGGDILMTLGGFVDVRFINDVATNTYNGSTTTQASTLMHELGHTLHRVHGGDLGLPNCRPNYLSVMNYLFQLAGLATSTGAPAIDYSRVGFGPLDETSLKEGVGLGGAMPYRTRYYAFRYNTTGTTLPSIHDGSTLDIQLGTTPAKRHCNGTPITDPASMDPGPGGPTQTVGYDAMVRVDGTTVAAPIDWDADGVNDGNTAIAAQDISFNATKSILVASTEEWSKLGLQQLASRRNAANASLGAMSVGFGLADQGPAGDEGVGDEGVGDEGVGDEGVGDEGVGDEGVGDEGVGDEGVGDEGVGDEGVGDEPSVDDGLGSAPTGVSAVLQSMRLIRVAWGKPPVGVVDRYNVSRQELTRTGFTAPVFLGNAFEPNRVFLDSTVGTNRTYRYLVNAVVRPAPTAPLSTSQVTSFGQSNTVTAK